VKENEMDAAAAVNAAPPTPEPVPAPAPVYVPSLPAAPVVSTPARKVPALALFLSLLMPGTGQLYNGQVAKAFTFFFAFAGCIWMAVSNDDPMPFPLLIPFVLFYNLIDAWQSASRINNRLAGNPALEDVDDESSPVWGGVLVAIGTLFLLRNLGWISLAFLSRWWPVLLIAGGITFLVRSNRRPVSPHVQD
jgi:hypothetical protein